VGAGPLAAPGLHASAWTADSGEARLVAAQSRFLKQVRRPQKTVAARTSLQSVRGAHRQLPLPSDGGSGMPQADAGKGPPEPNQCYQREHPNILHG
jgi:hypothetical protein